MNKIVANNIFKDYVTDNLIVPVLKDISLSIKEGDFCAITGPSGSGKSTLLYVLSGLEPVTKGDVVLSNTNLSIASKDQRINLRKHEIGFIFQFYNLIPNLTVYENVMLSMVLAKKPTPARVKEVLQSVSMLDYIHYFPHQLSGGMQQRVAIARSLVNSPKILFADEPTGNLDSENGHEIMKIFQRLNREHNITIVLVTHSLDNLVYCNRMIQLSDGKVIKDEKLPILS